MGTRSRIGLEHEDGTVTSIYCHWDGYPSYNGDILNEHYRERQRVEDLIALGDISSLRPRLAPEPGEKHSFDAAVEDVVIAYGRDRGENVPSAKDENADEMYRRACEGWEEYAYLYRQGVWFVTEVGGGAGPFLVKASDPEGVAPPNWQRLDAVLASMGEDA